MAFEPAEGIGRNEVRPQGETSPSENINGDKNMQFNEHQLELSIMELFENEGYTHQTGNDIL